MDVVFAFYRDFANLPKFLGDVIAIEPSSPSLWRWTIQGPLGFRTTWLTQLTEARENEVIRYHTVGLPGLKTDWEIKFRPSPEGGTEVSEAMTLPLGAAGRAALALMGKSPAAEVSANLHRLKQVLESGHVTDTDHAVRGKFREDRP